MCVYTGSIVFSDIEARDDDKPNTPNSDIYMWIAEGNNDGNFDLIQAEQKALLVLKKPLDFERGVRKFELIVMASVRMILFVSGSSRTTYYTRTPKLSQNTSWST